MGDRVAESVMRGKQPDSLSKTELELDTVPLTRAPLARPVRAWVRYGGVSIFIEAEAVAWTEYAVAVRWPANGTEHRAWVWASAARPR